MRMTKESITFAKPFSLAGLDGVQPAGTYKVITEEEELPNLSFVAWRRVATLMYLPAIGTNSSKEQVVTIDPKDLAAAVARDAAGGSI